MKRGEDVYSAVTPERFIAAPHPPLHYWLISALLPPELPDLDSPGQVSSIFQPGRFLSLFSSMATAVLLSLLVLLDGNHHRISRKTALYALGYGAVAGALFLSLPQVLVQATHMQSVMPMLALTMGGLACIAGSTGRGTILLLSLAVVLFALAFFINLAALAGIVAAGVYLLVWNRRTGLLWCGIMALALVVPFLVIDIATGHWLYRKMVDYNWRISHQPPIVKSLQQGWWEDQWPLLLLAGGYVLHCVVRTLRVVQMRLSVPDAALVPLVPIFALLSLFGLLISEIISGSGYSEYLLLPGVAVCACVGCLLAQLFAKISGERLGTRDEQGRAIWAGIVAAPLITGLLLAYVVFTSMPSAWYAGDLSQPTPVVQEQMRNIVRNVRLNGGSLVYSDNPGIPAIAGKEAAFNDLLAATSLANQGRWDETALRDMLRQKRFSMLVLSCDAPAHPASCNPDLFTPGVLDAIRGSYTTLFADVYYTIVPK